MTVRSGTATSDNSFPLIRVAASSLELWRGERCLFDGLTFQMNAPILHVRGTNGSGKTTLLKVLCGLTSAEHGNVQWTQENEPLAREDVNGLLAYAGHQDALNPALTVAENLEWGIGLYRPAEKAEIEIAMGMHGLHGLMPILAGNLSAGQKRRVALMRTVLSASPVWVWDEPYANLDSAGVDWVNQLINTHVDQGGSLILSAHQSPDADETHVQELELCQ